jgi:hypothetical protein
MQETPVPWGRAYSYTNSKGELIKVPARPITRPDLQVCLGRKQSPEHIANAGANRRKNSELLVERTKALAETGRNPKWEYMKQVPTEEIAGKMMHRALSQQIRKASEELINQNKDEWLRELHLAAQVILQKAIEERDQNALMAVWDRVVGKPTTQVDMNVQQDTTVDEIALQLQELQLKENNGKDESNTRRDDNDTTDTTP